MKARRTRTTRLRLVSLTWRTLNAGRSKTSSRMRARALRGRHGAPSSMTGFASFRNSSSSRRSRFWPKRRTGASRTPGSEGAATTESRSPASHQDCAGKARIPGSQGESRFANRPRSPGVRPRLPTWKGQPGTPGATGGSRRAPLDEVPPVAVPVGEDRTGVLLAPRLLLELDPPAPVEPVVAPEIIGFEEQEERARPTDSRSRRVGVRLSPRQEGETCRTPARRGPIASRSLVS